MRTVVLLTSLSLAAAVALSSCSSGQSPDETSAPGSSPSASSSAAASSSASAGSGSSPSTTSEPSSSSTSSGLDEDSASSSTDDSGTAGSSRSEPEETPQVLSTDASGKVLGMGQVFGASGDWDEQRYSGAGQSDVRGMGLTLTGCFTSYDAAGSYGSQGTGQLELRLDRKFQRLTFDAFQTNASSSSDETLVVEVLAGGEQVDIRRIAFDKLQDFDLPVAGKNAVKIRFFLEKNANCGYSTSATAAITDLTVI